MSSETHDTKKTPTEVPSGIPVVLDETTPLLRSNSFLGGTYGEATLKHEDVNRTTIFFQEYKTIGRNALPVFGSQILEYSFVFVSVFTLGHLSTTALAAISVATMTANVTGLSMIQGFCSALDTLLPSAWTSDQPQLVGLWAQRMAIMVFLEVIIILSLWFNGEGILLALRQDPEIAALAGQYLRWASFGLPAYGCTSIMRRWFQAQGLFSGPTKLICIVSPINLALNYTLVLGPESVRLGFIGAPISMAFCQYLLLFLNIGYAYFFTSGRAWHPLSSQAFTHLGIVVRLGLSGIGQLASEWWAWELVALAASLLGPIALAAQSILLTSSAMTFQVAVGVSLAAAVRIGNLLGEKDAVRAGIASQAAIILTLMTSSFTCLLLITFRKSWGNMFGNDPEVITLVSSVIPIIGLFQILDGNAAVTAAIMRAKGQQFVGAILTVTAYYCIGLPIGIWLAFKAKFGVLGLWWGLTISLAYCASIGTYLALITDWDLEVKKVQKRLGDEEASRKAARGQDEERSILQ